MTSIEELYERVAKATGPDKVLDRDILCTIGGWVYEKRGRDRQPWMYGRNGERRDPPGVGVLGAPRVTQSIDAALALVERLLPGKWNEILRDAVNALSKRFNWHATFATAEQMTQLPLAILSALLLALSKGQQP